MEYIRFGASGMKVSRMCIGCMSYGAPNEQWPWALNEEQSRPFIQRALELGINFFDTANVYSGGTSEEIVGKALRDFAPRDEVVVLGLDAVVRGLRERDRVVIHGRQSRRAVRDAPPGSQPTRGRRPGQPATRTAMLAQNPIARIWAMRS